MADAMDNQPADAMANRSDKEKTVPAVPLSVEAPAEGAQTNVVGPSRSEQDERALLLRMSRISHSGPLPPPEVLRGYEEVVAGAAKRIIVMAEKQIEHRHAMEDKVVSSDIARSYAGLWAGFGVALTSVIGGVIAVLCGHDGAGGTIATVSVVGLAGVFVYGTTMRKKEREEKAQLAAQPKDEGVRTGNQTAAPPQEVPKGHG